MFLHPRYAWIRQLAAFAVLLAVWEAAGRAGLLNPLYVPNPSRIGAALVELFSDGRIWPHLDATFTAALGGLALGVVVGILLGVAAALVRLIAELLEPLSASTGMPSSAAEDTTCRHEACASSTALAK